MKLIQAGYASENKLNAFILKAFVACLPHRFGDGLNSRLIDDRISNGVFDIKHLEDGDPIEVTKTTANRADRGFDGATLFIHQFLGWRRLPFSVEHVNLTGFQSQFGQ